MIVRPTSRLSPITFTAGGILLLKADLSGRPIAVRIQKKDLYHGAALTQIVEHPSFKALNKLDKKYGHYSLNHGCRVLMKLATTMTVRGEWQFTFDTSDLSTLERDYEQDDCTFVALVCGQVSVCLLDQKAMSRLVDLRRTSGQVVFVTIPPSGSQRVRGSLGGLGHTVPHNAFPNRLFAT
jgi:hypothetical protein